MFGFYFDRLLLLVEAGGFVSKKAKTGVLLRNFWYNKGNVFQGSAIGEFSSCGRR